jgi:hypothetical protein
LDSLLEKGVTGGDVYDPATEGGGAEVIDEVDYEDDGESGGSEADYDPGSP